MSFLNDRRVLVAGEIAVNSEAFENLTMLCDHFGSRFLATQEEKAAADFLAMKMREYGLQDTKVEPCTMFGWKEGELTPLWKWKRGTASIKLLEPTCHQLRCTSFVYSPSTPEEGLQAEVFNLRSGTSAYLLKHKDELKGKLVLDGGYTALDAWKVHRDELNLYWTTLYGYLVQFGAAGLIYANRHCGDLPKTGSARFGMVGEIPAVGISQETSQFILRQMAKGQVVANLNVKNSYALGATTYNVTADLPGHTYPDKIVLVGGHYDGYDVSVGALDDAAGVCVVLEAARALAKHGGPIKRTVRFCCFGSEEVFLNGSTGYVLSHADEIGDVELMINTDAAGISAKTGHSFEVCGNRELRTYLEQILSDIASFDRKWEVPEVTSQQKMVSPYFDHWPFYMLGVPAAHFRDVPTDPIDTKYSHTTADTVDKVSSKGLKDASTILALALIRVANETKLPFKHCTVKKIIRTLEENGTAEKLRLEKRWCREIPRQENR